MNRLEELLKDTFNELYKEKLKYVVLRNYRELPYSTSKDIDILVDIREIKKIKALLIAILRKHRFYYFYKSVYGVSFTLIGVSGMGMPNRLEVIFHCVTHISTSLNLLEKRINGLSKKFFYKDLNVKVIYLNGLNINILGKKDEFLTLYIHFNKKRKEKYMTLIIKYSKDKEINNWLYNHFGNMNWEEYLLGKNNSDYIIRKLYQDLWGFYSVKRYIDSHGKQLQILIKYLKYKKRKSIVYLSGPDGSGKTTIQNNLINYYKELNIRIKSYKTIHFFVAGITNRFRLKKRKNKLNDKYYDLQKDTIDFNGEERNRDTKKLTWKIRRYIGLIVALFDAIIIGRIVTLYYSLRGYLVIIETSPYDIFVKRHRPKFALTKKIFIPLLPKPTIGFIMDADPIVINNRKPELTIKEIKDYYKRTNKNLHKLIINKTFIAINTNSCPEQATREVIWKLNNI